MLISHEREKLLEAVKYFAANTKYCGLTKLFKLLFFFDFTHFRETGRSVTGLNYQAWQRGPVPADLYGEIKAGGRDDMTRHLKIAEPTTIDVEVSETSRTYFQDSVNTFGREDEHRETRRVRVPAHIRALKVFNKKLFTKRELRLMEEIAFMYKELKADQISEVSHLKGRPWHVTKTKSGLKAPIDYMLALDELREGAPTKEEILARIEERSEVLDALK